MEQRLTVLTLGVDDLERSLAFYRDGLGWTTPGIIGREFPHGAVAFFDLQAGLKFALFAREDLAHRPSHRLRPSQRYNLQFHSCICTNQDIYGQRIEGSHAH